MNYWLSVEGLLFYVLLCNSEVSISLLTAGSVSGTDIWLCLRGWGARKKEAAAGSFYWLPGHVSISTATLLPAVTNFSNSFLWFVVFSQTSTGVITPPQRHQHLMAGAPLGRSGPSFPEALPLPSPICSL